MDTFADVVNRLLPRSLSLAKLSREADIEYSYFHGLMQGRRTYIVQEEPVKRVLRPSPEKGLRTLDALERLGVHVTQEDRERMVTACLSVPEGFKLVSDAPGNSVGKQAPQIEGYDLLYTSGWEQLTGGEKRMFGRIIEALTEWKSQGANEHEAGGRQQPVA